MRQVILIQGSNCLPNKFFNKSTIMRNFMNKLCHRVKPQLARKWGDLNKNYRCSYQMKIILGGSNMRKIDWTTLRPQYPYLPDAKHRLIIRQSEEGAKTPLLCQEQKAKTLINLRNPNSHKIQNIQEIARQAPIEAITKAREAPDRWPLRKVPRKLFLKQFIRVESHQWAAQILRPLLRSSKIYILTFGKFSPASSVRSIK